VKCNFRLNCILKQELRCYDVRSKSLKKPPFRPHFRPFCPHPAYGSLLRAEGCTHFLAPPTSAWRPRPPGHWSPAPRPAPHHVGASGVGSCANPPPLATAIHRPPDWQRPSGARSRRSASLYSVCHRTRQLFRTAQSVSPRSPPPNRWPFARGWRPSTPGAPDVPAGCPSAAMPVLSLLSLISRNSPKQLGMVSPELPNRDDPACHVLSVGRASPSPFGPFSGERGFPRASSRPVLPWIGQDRSCRQTVDPANPARGIRRSSSQTASCESAVWRNPRTGTG